MEKVVADREQLRFENKFPIQGFTKHQIETILKHNPFLFREIFHERTVNNIYLDTSSFLFYKQNKQGISPRRKFRIRWYGEDIKNVTNPNLEVKIKHSQLGEKLKFSLPSFTFNKNITSKELKETFAQSQLPDEIKEQLHGLEPKLFNNYQRKYYQSFDKKFRLTLDWALTYYNIDHSHHLFLNQIVDQANMVIELKYLAKEQREMRQITSHFPFRADKNSKYINGIEKTFTVN